MTGKRGAPLKQPKKAFVPTDADLFTASIVVILREGDAGCRETAELLFRFLTMFSSRLLDCPDPVAPMGDGNRRTPGGANEQNGYHFVNTRNALAGVLRFPD